MTLHLPFTHFCVSQDPHCLIRPRLMCSNIGSAGSTPVTESTSILSAIYFRIAYVFNLFSADIADFRTCINHHFPPSYAIRFPVPTVPMLLYIAGRPSGCRHIFSLHLRSLSLPDPIIRVPKAAQYISNKINSCHTKYFLLPFYPANSHPAFL